MKEGDRVQVRKDVLLKGELHPHSGKTGIITELLGVRLSGPGWKPRAMIKIDEGCEHAGNTMIVSLEYLETIS